MAIEILREGNSVSNGLPARIDSFLQDFAQMYSGITYGDIMKFGKLYKTLSKDTLQLMKKYIKNIREGMEYSGGDIYDAAEEYDDVKQDCDSLVKLIKDTISNKQLDEDIFSRNNNYKVFTLTMDVAFPKDKSPKDYGVDSSVSGAQLYDAICKALDSLGLEMAGDFISEDGELTDLYQSNEYEFFD